MRDRQTIALLALVGLCFPFSPWLHALGYGGPLKCGTGGCETVQASQYAVLFGVPVAFYGVAGYLAILIVAVGALCLCVVRGGRRRGPRGVFFRTRNGIGCWGDSRRWVGALPRTCPTS